jgi:hypothetical protein
MGKRNKDMKTTEQYYQQFVNEGFTHQQARELAILASSFNENALLSSRHADFQAIKKEVGEMGFKDRNEAGQFALHTDGYNQAIEEVLTLLENISKK